LPWTLGRSYQDLGRGFGAGCGGSCGSWRAHAHALSAHPRPATKSGFGAQVRLVVLDSVAFHFRSDWDDMAARTRTLALLAQALMRLAEAHDAAARPGDAGSVSCQGAVQCPTVCLV
jgi:hypothetical protein